MCNFGICTYNVYERICVFNYRSAISRSLRWPGRWAHRVYRVYLALSGARRQWYTLNHTRKVKARATDQIKMQLSPDCVCVCVYCLTFLSSLERLDNSVRMVRMVLICVLICVDVDAGRDMYSGVVAGQIKHQTHMRFAQITNRPLSSKIHKIQPVHTKHTHTHRQAFVGRGACWSYCECNENGNVATADGGDDHTNTHNTLHVCHARTHACISFPSAWPEWRA